MAKYSSGIYGVSKYGEKEISRTYYNSAIASWAYSLNSVSLLWQSITADPADPVPTHWRLVRSFNGTPDNPFDADFIDGDIFGLFRNSHLDENVADDVREVNYSIWIFNGTGWVFCGDTNVVLIQYADTFELVAKWLPKAWLNSDDGVGDATGEYNYNDLTNTLIGYSFMYDKIKAEIDLLQKTPSQKYFHHSLLPAQMSQLGFSYEPALGDSYHRSLYQSGNIINSLKGTELGIKTYVTALTHLGNTIVVGHNLMLDYNDSSFEESVGRWSVSSGSLVQGLYSTSATDLGTAISAPVPPLYDKVSPYRALGYAKLTPTQTTTTMSLPAATSNPLLYGIPVKKDLSYLFSGWVRHLNAPSTISAVIQWWDYLGNNLGSTAANTHTSQAGWTEFTTKSDSGRNGQQAPETAAYATITLTITRTIGSVLIFDLFQFAEADPSLEYEDARRVRVYLEGEKENIIPNPSFEQGVGGWVASANGSFAQDPTIYNTAVYSGSCVGELTIQSAPTGNIPQGLTALPGGYVSTDWFPVTPGQNYTFSVYASTEYEGFGRAIPRIEFSNRESVEKQTYTLNDSNGYYYETASYFVDGTAVDISPSIVTYAVNQAVATNSGTTVTYTTTAPHNLSVGECVSITGLSPSTFNLSGIFIDSITSNTFTITTGQPALPPTFAGTPITPITGTTTASGSGLATVVDGLVTGTPPQFPAIRERISVSAIAPVYTRDSGMPLAKVSVYAPDATTDMTFWLDAALFQETANLDQFFSGDGAIVPTNPNTQAYYVGTDCFWETKNIYNLIQNPGFNDTSNWTVSGGALVLNTSTTNFASARTVNPDQTYGGVYPITFGPLFGTSMGQFNYNPFSSGGSISTTVYLPSPALGGEDFVVSAFIRSAEGTYTITTSGNGVTTTDHMEVYQHDQYQWIRIHAIRQLTPGETSFNLTIAIAPPAGFAYQLAPTSFFCIDGVQAEYGRIPSKPIYPGDGVSSTITNPLTNTATMTVAQTQSGNGGRSSYIFNRIVKTSRLAANLPLVMPYGSTWCLKLGAPAQNYPDLTESLIPSASFEKDLGTWASVNSTLQRVIYQGTLSGDFITHGAAYCLVKTAGSSGSKTFGITSPQVDINGGYGYYSSVALRPANSDSTGTYTLRVDFYSPTGSIIKVYRGNTSGNVSTNTLDFTSVGESYMDVTDAYRSQTFNITHTDRWAYLSKVFPANTTFGAAMAELTVTFTPATFASDQAFHIDRCVFRE